MMVTALATATAAALWLYLHTGQLDNHRSDRSLQPDLYIDQPHWNLFDQQGQIRKQLHASRLEQWPDENGARLTEPQLDISDRKQRQWQATARRGRINPDDQSILLEQEVVLKQEPDNRELVIKTGKLRITQSGDAIETDDAVVLVAGSWHFTAIGLRTSLGQQRMELLKKVRGRHE
jgi:LPS export ABC transporter protein LptC